MDKFEKNLNSLGKMLKKRSNSDFQLDLRNQLTKKANEMNAVEAEKEAKKTPKKSPRRSWSFGPFFKKGLAPVTAGVLVLALGFYILMPGGGQLGTLQFVDIADAKDYYVLTPIDEDSSGIDGSAGFRLESKGEVSAKDVEDVIEVEPFVDVEVEQDGPSAVIITPETAMDAGEIYTLEIDGKELKDSPYAIEYSWAYQVSDQFRVSGTLPGNQETSVPTNSGIEMNFNYRGVTAEDLEQNFTIEPYVDGYFEVNGKVGLFVPSGLAAQTVYTVTLGADLTLAGSENSLGEDYVFQFETYYGEDYSSGETYSYAFREDIYNFSPNDPPTMNVQNYAGWNSGFEDNYVASVQVYKYASGEDFLDAIKAKKSAVPSWTYYAGNYYSTPTDGLDLVLEVDEAPIYDGYSGDMLVLPQSLDNGYYLVKSQNSGTEDDALVQVSNLGTYLSMTETDSLVWVNDVVTGEAVSGAKIEIIDESVSESTNKQGIAYLKDALSKASDADGYLESYLKVSSGNSVTYYDISTYYYESLSSSDYWSVFETERLTYHPTDDIYFWGFLEGRDVSATGGFEVKLVDRYWFYDYGYIYGTDEIYYSQDLKVKDGESFEGVMNVEKLAPGYYTLVLMQDDNIIESVNLDIEDFIKPAFDISVEAEESILFHDESTQVNISSSFFEGTPVPNLPVIYYNYIGGKDSQYLQTDESGELTVDFDADPGSCDYSWCNLFYTDYLNVYPENSEEADINGSTKVSIIRSYNGITNIEASHEGFTLETRYVDMDKIENLTGYLSNSSDVYGDIAPNTQVDVEVVKYTYTKTEEGEYYDHIDKVVKKKYYYRSSDEVISTFTLYSDENGVIDYPMELDEDASYDFNFTIHDDKGGFYKDDAWVTRAYDTYDSYKYLSLQADKESYDIGDTVSLELAFNEEQPLPENGTYLYLELQSGLEDYDVNSSSKYSFGFDQTMIPNIYYAAVLFDGEYYWTTSYVNVEYDYEVERLNVEITSEQDTYEPGDEASLSFKITEEETGNPANADLNIYLVDEAYYSLYAETFRDPLNSLYSNISTGVEVDYASHKSAQYMEGGMGGCFVAGTQILMADGSFKDIEDIAIGDRISTREDEFSNQLVAGDVLATQEHLVNEYMLINGSLGVTEEHVVFANNQWQLAGDLEVGDVFVDYEGNEVPVLYIEHVKEPVYVYNFEVGNYHTYFADGLYVHNDKGGAREEFRDTAVFEVIECDNGTCSVDFELPDNITSWRVVASAVNSNLQAGYGSVNVDVSKPVFALPVLNTEYLAGDNPSIPLRAYGDLLNADTEVVLGVESDGLAVDLEENGMAYQPTYFGLGTLASGEYKVSSYTELGDEGDLIVLPITVTDSHFTAESVWSGIVSAGMELVGSETERTEVSFMNNEVGSYYNAILNYAYANDGDRADQAAGYIVARGLLNDYFDENLSIPELSTYTYQDVPTYDYYYDVDESLNGGIGLLPYDDSRLDLTVKLTALDSSLWDENYLRSYFSSILDSNEYTLTEKIMAIYGLSALGESYLNDLNYFVSNYELGLEDKIYAALAYMEFGAKSEAADLYVDIMDNHTKMKTVTMDGALLDEELSWTAFMAKISAELGSNDHEILWEFVRQNDHEWSEDRLELIVAEKLMYARTLLELGANTEVTFKLNGEKISLVGYERYSVSMLPEELTSASFTDINGEVAVTTRFADITSPEQLETEPRISIDRTYYVDGVATTTFNTGDLVKIMFTVNVPLESDLEGGYRVTDFLPSGLKTTTQRSTSDGWTTGFRNPYDIVGQESSFYLYCGEDSNGNNTCANKQFYYYARIINQGEFIAEPAIIQKYSDPDMLGLSGGIGGVTIW